MAHETKVSANNAIEIRGLSKTFGQHRVLDTLNLDIEAGQIVAFVGPSGCGKSTLLNCIVGTMPQSTGTLSIWSSSAGKALPVQGPGRDRGIVYQRYSLFPHLNAIKNVAMGLMLDETQPSDRWFSPRKWRKLRKQHLEQAEAMLVKVGLGSALDKYPSELSGGMCQRVAIAQALVMRPKVLLMDEPFGALDEATRESLQHLMLDLYQENVDAKAKSEHPPHTVIIVTHELEEAIYVGDRIIALSQRDQPEKGARIVYDAEQPVFTPTSIRDQQAILEIKQKIVSAAFDPASPSDL